MDKTAIIYARVSTAKQADEDLPIASQVQQCQAKAEALGVTVLKVFQDEGFSGRYDNRPAFQDAVAYCEIAGVDHFITWSTSRFSRSKTDAPLYKRRLEKSGTTVTFVSMDFDRATNAGWVTESVMELFDELYSRQVSEDTRRSMIKNAKDGYWNGGHVPFGFNPVPDMENPKRKRLEPHEYEARVVNKIFTMRAEGHGAVSIAATLNQKHILRRVHKWNKTTILNLLRNHAVLGKVVYGRKDSTTRRKKPKDQWLIVDAHQPIIDLSTWQKVQSLMDKSVNREQTGSPKSTHLFTGLVRCAKCGYSMQIETATGRNRTYSYYNCRSALTGGGCAQRRIRADRLENWLLDVIGNQVFTRENLCELIEEIRIKTGQWLKSRNERKQLVESQMRSIKSKNEKIFELFELMGKDAPNLGDLTTRLRGNNDQIKALDVELRKINQEKPPKYQVNDQDIDQIRELLKATMKKTPDSKKTRGFISSFISKIEIGPSVLNIYYDPAKLIMASQPVHSKESWLPERSLLRTKKLRVVLPDWMRAVA